MAYNLEYEYYSKGYEGIKDQFMLGSGYGSSDSRKGRRRSKNVIFSECKWAGADGSHVIYLVTPNIKALLERLLWLGTS